MARVKNGSSDLKEVIRNWGMQRKISSYYLATVSTLSELGEVQVRDGCLVRQGCRSL